MWQLELTTAKVARKFAKLLEKVEGRNGPWVEIAFPNTGSREVKVSIQKPQH